VRLGGWASVQMVLLISLHFKFHILAARKVKTLIYCHARKVTIDGVWIGNRMYSTVTERNYSLTELHTPKVTVTIAHIKYSQFSLAVAW
jgi:hypothetical protein